MTKPIVLLLSLICCSCIQLGGSPQEIDYYRLNSSLMPQEETSRGGSNIALKLIGFPTYLDKKQIVTQVSQYEVKSSTTAYWAEPLQDNLLNTLRRNLKHHLPGKEISISPWDPQQPEAVMIEFVVDEFTGKLGESILVEIDWRAKKEQTIIARGQFVSTKKIGHDYIDLTAALSESLNDFSLVLKERLINLP